MNVKIADLMVKQVLTASRHKTVGHVKELMSSNGIHALPVIGEEGEPIGIVTSSDLLEVSSDTTPISQIMTRNVYTVPQYNGAHIAARVMRNHGIHHVVVTHEKKIVGVISSFDLLQLVENHRFVMKNAPG